TSDTDRRALTGADSGVYAAPRAVRLPSEAETAVSDAGRRVEADELAVEHHLVVIGCRPLASVVSSPDAEGNRRAPRHARNRAAAGLPADRELPRVQTRGRAALRRRPRSRDAGWSRPWQGRHGPDGR